MDTESIVKRSLLPCVGSFCPIFGRQKANDTLLSHMITYLNDKDWQLRRYIRDTLFRLHVGVARFSSTFQTWGTISVVKVWNGTCGHL